MTVNSTPPGARGGRRFVVPVGIGAAGVIAGAVLAATISANAASSTPSSTAGTSTSATASNGTAETHGSRDETVVTNTGAVAKVKAAVLAKYPGATVNKVETDSTGEYEAEITTAAGKDVHVGLSKTFAVTGERSGGGHHHGHSNTDAAHEATESPARAAQEAAEDAAQGATSG